MNKRGQKNQWVQTRLIVERKEYTPSMMVLLGEEARITIDDITLAIRALAYLPDVIN